jgi:hypothetical protein
VFIAKLSRLKREDTVTRHLFTPCSVAARSLEGAHLNSLVQTRTGTRLRFVEAYGTIYLHGALVQFRDFLVSIFRRKKLCTLFEACITAQLYW